MIFDREIFRRQAEGVPPHRIEHIIALQTLFSRNNIERSVGTGMPNMQPLPGWIREYTGTEPEFVFTSGTEFPDDLAGFRLIVHCGGCMLNEREMKYRMECAKDQGIPMTNYGILIAYTQGILKRSLGPFPEIASLLG